MATADRAAAACSTCGSSLDSLHFDAIGFADLPPGGGLVVIAKHELPRQYCGVLEGFQQFLSPAIQDGREVETPGIEWLLRANGRPLDPYIGFTAVLNPWGEAFHRIAISLEEGTVLEMAARVTRRQAAGARIGGRLMGRYWFEDPYARTRPR